jgi:hypothetical protein
MTNVRRGATRAAAVLIGCIALGVAACGGESGTPAGDGPTATLPPVEVSRTPQAAAPEASRTADASRTPIAKAIGDRDSHGRVAHADEHAAGHDRDRHADQHPARVGPNRLGVAHRGQDPGRDDHVDAQ